MTRARSDSNLVQWSARPRNYENENSALDSSLAETAVAEGDDILTVHAAASGNAKDDSGSEAQVKASSKPEESTSAEMDTSVVDDPLSMSVVDDPLQAGADPLSMASVENAVNEVQSRGRSGTNAGSTGTTAALGVHAAMPDYSKLDLTEAIGLVSWLSKDDEDELSRWKKRKIEILDRYTTSKSIPVVSKIIDEGPRDRKVVSGSDKIQARLETLEGASKDAATRRKEVSYLTQKDCVRHIEGLHDRLLSAWKTQDRVKSLMTAIECSKLLSETSVPQFYPSLFVLVGEVLDVFGNLVFQRLVSRSTLVDELTGRQTPLPANFTYRDVPREAQETCNNWFYKISSIREILPRLFIELTLLKCQRFLVEIDNVAYALRRLSMCARGIGDPLVQFYVRCYLIRKGMEVLPNAYDYMVYCYRDMLVHLASISTNREKYSEFYERAGMTYTEYLDLFTPAIQWMMAGLSRRLHSDQFASLVKQYQKKSNSGLILSQLLSEFPAPIVVPHIMELKDEVVKAEPDSIQLYKLYVALGVHLISHPPSKEKRLSLLNDIWRLVTQLESKEEYCLAAQVYIEYVAKFFKEREINIFLGDVRKHLGDDSETLDDKTEKQLHNIIMRVLAHRKDFSKVFAMENFLPLIDRFSVDQKLQVAKTIVAAFVGAQTPTSDPIVINSIIHMEKLLHGSISSMTPADELKQIGVLICKSIHFVDFGLSFEEQLQFYVDCRSAFPNLDAVKYDLVIGSLRLIQRTLAIVGGRTTKKTLNFVRGCIAYAHITIPSITDVVARCRLFTLTASIALQNKLVVQAETLFRAAIHSLTEFNVADLQSASDDEGPHGWNPQLVQDGVEQGLVQWMAEFANALIPMPGHHLEGPVYLVEAALDTIRNEFEWLPRTGRRCQCLIYFLGALSALGQERLPAHVSGLDSNDALYVGEEARSDYMDAVQGVASKLVEEILSEITSLGRDTQPGDLSRRLQASLSLSFQSFLLSNAQWTPFLCKLYYQLDFLSQKAVQAGELTDEQQRQWTHLRNEVKKRASSSGAKPVLGGDVQGWRDLAQRLQL